MLWVLALIVAFPIVAGLAIIGAPYVGIVALVGLSIVAWPLTLTIGLATVLHRRFSHNPKFGSYVRVVIAIILCAGMLAAKV